MYLYRLEDAILLVAGKDALVQPGSWDNFVNDDQLLHKCQLLLQQGELPTVDVNTLRAQALAPISGQELWASGVTYLRSRDGRQEESAQTGGADFYARVYDAARPELFFKANAHRVAGPGGRVRIRADSDWNVPEPELVLLISSTGTVVGYTIGNDMSSRSIEGDNPLYLPQAKTYDGCAALGPGILVADGPLPPQTTISCQVRRAGQHVFQGSTALHQMKRELAELCDYLFRECSFPHGVMLMTGTGIVPEREFSLRAGDEIFIEISGIGTLINTVS